MISKNKLFKVYLLRQSALHRCSLKNTDFIVKCRNQWKLMSDNEQQIYAKLLKKSISENSSKEWNKQKEKEEQKLLQKLYEEIENKIIDSLFKNMSKEYLMDTKFFFISFNIQSKTEKTDKQKEEYFPLEIGLIEYTIRDGIRLDYHQFIDCEELPYGHCCEAADRTNEIHKIPAIHFIDSSNDYILIGSQILDFLSDSCVNEEINQCFDKPMIVFSQKEEILQNRGALQWIEKKYNEMRQRVGQEINPFNVKVLSASKLFASLMNCAGSDRSMIWCENAITSHAFDYTMNTDCPFHEDMDCIYCAIGVPKRMAYLISYFLRDLYDIELTSNHLPLEEQEFQNFRIKEEVEEEEDNNFRFILTEEEIGNEDPEKEKQSKEGQFGQSLEQQLEVIEEKIKEMENKIKEENQQIVTKDKGEHRFKDKSTQTEFNSNVGINSVCGRGRSRGRGRGKENK